MDFRTIAELPNEHPTLHVDSHALLLGSCFADEVGRRLEEALPPGQVAVNPCGVLYNPASIASALRIIACEDGEVPAEGFFAGRDGLWRHWFFSGEFAAPTLEACQEKIGGSLKLARALFAKADALFVTFGTDRAYRLRNGAMAGKAVANCHKEEAARFEEVTLPAAEMLEAWTALLRQLLEQQPALRVVFTLSPYRYRKYGLHGSQLSKARLLCLIDELLQRFPENLYYFPAYEIVLDELRDYRFYDRDMLHPSPQAVDYVWERFSSWCFSARLSEYAAERETLQRDVAHRPLHPDSPEALRFAERLAQRKQKFEQKWGHAF